MNDHDPNMLVITSQIFPSKNPWVDRNGCNKNLLYIRHSYQISFLFHSVANTKESIYQPKLCKTKCTVVVEQTTIYFYPLIHSSLYGTTYNIIPRTFPILHSIKFFGIQPMENISCWTFAWISNFILFFHYHSLCIVQCKWRTL